MPCLDGNEWVDFFDGRLSEERVRHVDRHLDGCESCRKVAAEMARSGAGPAEPRDVAGQAGLARAGDLARGDTLDRFHIVHRLGAGAMGVVYAAYDPTLDRRCALKLLRSEHLPATTAETATARLMQEARALARLSHPNVVAVHEVGRTKDQTFLVMELVDGQNLTTWLARERRSWREIVRIFIDAAEGLAAAHALGLVHRDFKPDNVLVGNDGRVRVSDFGLARLNASSVEPPPSRSHGAPSSAQPYLTRTGAVLGTPAYLAPEVIDGGEATAASDQFGFCVALAEALEGERPFVGRSLSDFREAHRRGWQPRPNETDGARIPTAVVALLRRGLRESPGARFGSMTELANALRKLTAPRRRLATGSIVVATLVLVAVSALWVRQATVCVGAAASLAPVWNQEARAGIRTALRQSDVSYAESTLKVVEQGLEAYARAWQAARIDACQATYIRDEQDEDTLSRRVQCLEEHLAQLDAVVSVLSRSDAAVAERAAHTLNALGDLSRCADLARLQRHPVPSDAKTREALEKIADDTTRARALQEAAQYEEAIVSATRAVENARALGSRAAEAQALEVLGVLQQRTKDGVAAEATLVQAVLAAEASDQDHIAALAWVRLIHARGVARTNPAGADQADAHARALISRLRDDELEAHRLYNLAAARIIDGRLEDARQLYSESLSLRERLHSGPHVAVLASLVGVADATMMLGRYAEAVPLYERARDGMSSLLGPDHPEVANILHNLGTTLLYTGNHERARELLNISIALREKALGPDHALLCSSHTALGMAHTYAGNTTDGVSSFRRALDICDKALGPDHASTVRTATSLAEGLLTAGRPKEALPVFQRAVVTREKQLGSEHVALSYPLAGLGDALRQSGRASEAIPVLERAVRLTNRPDRSVSERALIQLRLAKALWEEGRDRPRARVVANTARGLLEGSPPTDVAAVQKEIDGWLEEIGARARRR